MGRARGALPFPGAMNIDWAKEKEQHFFDIFKNFCLNQLL
jgi:hypothetical protein